MDEMVVDSVAEIGANSGSWYNHHGTLEINFKPIRYEYEEKRASEKIEESNISKDLEHASRRLLKHAENCARNPEDLVRQMLSTGVSYHYNDMTQGNGNEIFFNVCNSQSSINLNSKKIKKYFRS